jgi:hypothetical protein
VSSALDEVKRYYLGRLAIAQDHDDFIRSVERLLSDRQTLPIEENKSLAAEQSWERVATEMLDLVEARL